MTASTPSEPVGKAAHRPALLQRLRARLRPGGETAGTTGRSLTWQLGIALGWRLVVLWIGLTILVTMHIRHEVNELEQYYDDSLVDYTDAITDIDTMSAAEIHESLRRAIAERHSYRLTAIVEVSLSVLLPVLIVVPLSLLGLWTVLRRELAPLGKLSQQIAARGDSDLSPLVASGLPRELSRLIDDVNRLLERLRRALEAERSFAGNSAHELRTPIAGALAQTQRLLTETRGTSLHARAGEIEMSLHQLQSLANRLLELSRAEGAGVITESETDLAPLLPMIVNEMRREHRATDRLHLVDDPQPLPAHLDRDAIYVLLRNLIENALLHGDPQAPVKVIRRGRRVDVINSGPVLTTGDFERLGQRFVRGKTGSGGSGLGLAIVRSVVDGGRLDLSVQSPVDGQPDGVCIRLLLP